jgi:hypothetical protein
MIDAEYSYCVGHFATPDFADAVLVYLLLGQRIEHVATFAPRTRSDENFYALSDIAGNRCGSLARLIVGVGMDG